MSDIIETLNKAIDMQVQQRIQEAQLDKTVLCQVLETDWTDASKGEYYVSEGEAKYVAYGTPDGYRTRDNVWVLIPKGDYNNQKLIVSKQVTDDNDAFIYVSPLDRFVQLTGNIIPNPIPETGLITNQRIHQISAQDEGPFYTTVLLANLNESQDSVGDKFSQLVNGFDRFGISAKFRTNLSNLQVLHGNYGLKITITFTSEVTKGGEKYNVQSENVVYLQVDDMFGNPFAYDTYFTQEKMFEVANALNTKIENIKIEFFEEDKTWWDALGNQLDPAADPINNIPNLFVKDVALYFGTAAENAANKVYLYSNSSAKFDVRDGYPANYNNKTLETKFVYQAVDNNYYTINGFGANTAYAQLLENNLIDPITVRWYKFHQQYDVDDDRAGAGWEDVTDEGSTTDLIRDFILDNPNVPFEKFKVAFIMNDCGDVSITEENQDAFNSETRYWSDELQFLNGDDQTWASMDLINSLNLVATDNYKGNYALYNAAPAGQSKIINLYEAHINRTIRANFKSYITGDTDLDKASLIRWYIPKNNTMITVDLTDELYGENGHLAEVSPLDETEDIRNNYYIFQGRTNSLTGKNLLVDDSTEVHYRIKEYFNQRWTNNKIKCKIIRNGKAYEREIELQFGTKGVNGTEYSLLVSLGDEYDENDNLIATDVPAWTITHSNSNYLKLKAQLYNEQSLPIANVSYTWRIDPLTRLSDLFAVSEDKLIRTNTAFSGTGGHQFGAYLECTATTNQNKTYKQRLVVPLRRNSNWVDCTGTKEVIYTYQNTGPTVSSNDPYVAIYYNGEAKRVNPDNNNSALSVAYVYDKNNDVNSEEVRDLPKIKQVGNGTDRILVPPQIFYADENYAMSVQIWDGNNLIWSQPILIYRDVYTNTVLNEWDGSQKIDSKNNRIMTASVFAGKKESNNSFTGVIMGQLQGEYNNKTFGLYGRNQGYQAFGFNVDGTAYLGDETKARILFDSTHSTIQNNGYNSGTGIKIDFDGGFTKTGTMYPHIDIQGNGNQVYLSAEANRLIDARVNALDASDHSIAEGSGYKKTSLLHVGGDAYYLQTANYENSGGARGLRINLSTGTLDSRDKLTITGAAGSKIKFGNVELGTGDASSGYLTSTGSLTLSGGTVGTDSSLYLSTNNTSSSVSIGGSNALNTWRLTVGSKFGVTSDGTLYATAGTFGGNIVGGSIYIPNSTSPKFSVTSTGTLTATDGTIGGWIINSTNLRSSDETYNSSNGMILQPAAGTYALAIGADDPSNHSSAPFWVKHTGEMKAASGTIGGWKIGTNSLYSGSTYLYSSGKIKGATITGSTISGSTIRINGTSDDDGFIGYLYFGSGTSRAISASTYNTNTVFNFSDNVRVNGSLYVTGVYSDLYVGRNIYADNLYLEASDGRNKQLTGDYIAWVAGAAGSGISGNYDVGDKTISLFRGIITSIS